MPPMQTCGYIQYKQNFFIFLIVYHQACAKVRLFVGFEFFKTIFQAKSNLRLCFTAPIRYDFISETVARTRNLTKNKPVKVQIIAG